jgi:hypothetical protein
MSPRKQNHGSTAAALGELTGRPVEEFKIPEDVTMPAPEELNTHDAAEFYPEEKR